MNLVVLASGYLRWPNDKNYEGDFVTILSRGLAKHFTQTFVIAPRDENSAPVENDGKIEIHRHRQGFFRHYGLAYGSGILPNIKKNRLLALMVPWFIFFQLLTLFKLHFSKKKIDAIHAHWIIPQGIVGVLYKSILNPKCRLVVTSHGADALGDDYSVSTRIRNFFLRLILSKIDCIAVTNSLLFNLFEKLGYRGELKVYPMGVWTRDFSPENSDVKLESSLSIKRPYLLFLGSLIERKGVVPLLDAAARYFKTNSKITLVLAGDGHLRSSLEKRSKELGIAERVRFLGYISDSEKKSLLAGAEIFVFPSYSEGFGVVNLEAMSSGTTVLVSPLEPFKDYLTEGETGFFFPNWEPNQMADCISRTLESDRTLQKQRSRRLVAERYDWGAVIENYRSILCKPF